MQWYERVTHPEKVKFLNIAEYYYYARFKLGNINMILNQESEDKENDSQKEDPNTIIFAQTFKTSNI